jgi:biotin-(acetyl-CoA carboxylase) ligase
MEACKLNRKEMISELLERFEAELDELNNGQLSSFLTEYEHIPMLTSLIENLADEEDDSDDDDKEDSEDDNELLLIDGDWSDEEDED